MTNDDVVTGGTELHSSVLTVRCYFQHEKSRKVPAPLQPETAAAAVVEKRRVFRKSYDSTGPHDERYYVSASSGIGAGENIFKLLLKIFHITLKIFTGTDGSKTETDSSGKEEEGNIFVKLLQNQVLNYNSHSHKEGHIFDTVSYLILPFNGEENGETNYFVCIEIILL